MVMRDDSNRSIELTMWGAYANNPGDQLQAVSERLSALHWLTALAGGGCPDPNAACSSLLLRERAPLCPVNTPARSSTAACLVAAAVWPVQMVQGGAHPVVAVKNARVGDYNGKTLSTGAHITACTACRAH